jgi:ankyrin repeat protein
METHSINLHKAVKEGDVRQVITLLKRGADPNIALHLAVRRNLKLMAEILLNHGADPNTRDAIGNTPLHYAVFYAGIVGGDAELVTMLLDHGADLNIRSNGGETPRDLERRRCYE